MKIYWHNRYNFKNRTRLLFMVSMRTITLIVLVIIWSFLLANMKYWQERLFAGSSFFASYKISKDFWKKFQKKNVSKRFMKNGRVEKPAIEKVRHLKFLPQHMTNALSNSQFNLYIILNTTCALPWRFRKPGSVWCGGARETREPCVTIRWL